MHSQTLGTDYPVTQALPEYMFSPFLAEKYGPVKARFPAEGRRKWRLRVAEEFWSLSPDERASYSATCDCKEEETAEFNTDPDPLDDIAGEDAPALGIIVRTDYSDEDAWEDFVAVVHEGEAEFATADPHEADQNMDEDAPSSGQPSTSTGTGADEEMEDADEESDTEPSHIFTILSVEPSLQPQFTNISNLAALRLLNNVGVCRAPLPQGSKRVKPQNRLIDRDTWQEVYQGKMLWIYDGKSNTDRSVRVVSQKGGVYGTATADSWRARSTHICELQVNLASGAMTIDFGGLDRYDYEERVRNLREAENTIS